MTSLGLSFLTGKMGAVRLAPSWQGIERTQEVMHVMHLLFKICIYFGCAGSSLLRRLFSSCREWELLSSGSTWASHCGDFSRSRAWPQALGLQ